MNRRFVLLAALSAISSMAFARQPQVQFVDGDLIFQNSRSAQSAAIFSATGSPFTHMGIIVKLAGGLVVLEAGPTVREVPLASWIASGADGAFAVYRMDGLDDHQRAAIVAAARSYAGRPYDLFFDFAGEAIYCSELPYLAFGAAGISIGKVQSVSELNLGAAAAQALIKERWRKHPRCTGLGQRDCVAAIMDQKLITPASIAADMQFHLIHSTFKFGNAQ